MLRAIREIQPRWVVGENVFGLVNWSGGLVFHEVQTDLEAEGYEVWPYVLPACAKDAPHRRDRIWFIAYRNNGNRKEIGFQAGGKEYLDRAKRKWLTTDADSNGLNRTNSEHEINTGEGWLNALNDIEPVTTADTLHKGLQGRQSINGWKEYKQKGRRSGFAVGTNSQDYSEPTFDNFPTQSPLRSRNDGLSRQLSRYITKELLYEISNTSQENRIEDLPEVWKRISQEKVWQKIRGFYSLESKNILLQTMQLYSTNTDTQNNLSPFSEKVSEPILQHLRKYGNFRSSPQGQELEKQRSAELGNTLSFLPHEVALAARRFEVSITKFDAWHRAESIKAYGNAIVPQVAFEIFKAIEQYECSSK